MPGFKQKCERDKYELFQVSGRHYGIRTGFPTTEIDFIVALDSLAQNVRELEKVYYVIAQNGFYIPITNKQGEIIFTPSMYQEYRRTFNGLERFYGEPLEIISAKKGSEVENKHYEQISEIIPKLEKEAKKLAKYSQAINQLVMEVLQAHYVPVKESEFDPGIIGAELINIGSTGRGTHKPGDAYDFDFTLKLDAKDFSRASQIAEDIKKRLEISEDKSHSEPGGYYQLIIKEAKGLIDPEAKRALAESIDFDIGFAKKSDIIIFGSHNAIEEKLDSLDDNMRQEVIANIVLTKKILTDGQAYKRVEHGGFGGIGVENWILANNGNMLKAFETFLKAAYDKKGNLIPLEQFGEKYKILNAGMNLKHLYHDNYTANLKKEGYEAMIKAIENYLRTDN